MLDPWIIEELKRREREKERREQPALPVPEPPPPPVKKVEDETPRRGVIVIDL